MANTLLNRMDGFKIGNTTLPCTKGIWIWGRPIINGDKATVVLDTEGLHSICKKFKTITVSQRQASRRSDSRNFSSGFIRVCVQQVRLTSFSVIDEKELSELTAVISLTKWVKEGDAVPSFLWCLRDFTLGKQTNRRLHQVLERRHLHGGDPIDGQLPTGLREVQHSQNFSRVLPRQRMHFLCPTSKR